jgi:hypothetical protein
VFEEIPFDRICPECGKEIEAIERQFGRANKPLDTDSS